MSTVRVWIKALFAPILIAALILPAQATSASTVDAKKTVIVQKTAGSGSVPEALTTSLGGEIGYELPIINAFSATVPEWAITRLQNSPGVRFVTEDAPVQMHGLVSESDTLTPSDATTGAADPSKLAPAEPAASAHPAGTLQQDPNTPTVYQKEIGANIVRANGTRGAGSVVALIDTGVADVPDLAGRIVPVTAPNGSTKKCVDISGENTCNDSYGHGTFLAGLIAGTGAASDGKYKGVAPGAKILSIKIGGRDGSASVGKILFAIQWVALNKTQYGIDVLNLSLGTDSTQSYRYDPLNYAVEKAWQAGIAVVVSAGNRGPDAGTISKPADDPFVITTGAVDDVQTVGITDDKLPDFSSRGPTASDGITKPDITAPGSRLVSLRSPGSAIEEQFPGGGVNETYRRGSGTSQSAAVVSGSVALLLSKYPSLTPDQVKYILTHTANATASDDPNSVGAGLLDIAQAVAAPPSGEANQGVTPSGGIGSIAASQGSVGLVARASNTVLGPLKSVVPLKDVDNADPSGGGWYGTGWYGGGWYGGGWYGGGWYGGGWYGGGWYGGGWYGGGWYGGSWYGGSWYGAWD